VFSFLYTPNADGVRRHQACHTFARRTPLLLSAGRGGFTAVGPCQDRTDRQTDRQTDTVPLHRPCSAHYAGSANKPAAGAPQTKILGTSFRV